MNILFGLTPGHWWQLLRENNFAVSPHYWGLALYTTARTFITAAAKRKDEQLYGNKVAAAEIKPPIFVLGHWRSGTSFLHNLLVLDDHFAFPNIFQVSHPHTFLYREEAIVRALRGTGSYTRPMDNMEITFESPGEDECALSIMSLCSPLLAWSFPNNAGRYDRYYTFQGVGDEKTQAWKDSLVLFLKRLTVRYDRPLVLKSPPHTARIRLLLELFPEAKFIHIHRDPYTVFQSTRRLYDKSVPLMLLHGPGQQSFDDVILQRYKRIYDAFFAERDLIPQGHFHEVCFEDLERDGVCVMKELYHSLQLGDFAAVEPKIRQYLADKAAYKKNAHSSLSPELRNRVRAEWDRNFREWGYDD